jgi:hypothetical protein
MRFGLLYVMYGDEPEDTRLYQEIQTQVASRCGATLASLWSTYGARIVVSTCVRTLTRPFFSTQRRTGRSSITSATR